MTTTELIELLKKYERGGATGRPREVMFEVGDRIINTDGIEVIGSGDGLVTELYLSLPSAQPDRSLWFRIGEICVDESKGFISSGRAVEKIRELLREVSDRKVGMSDEKDSDIV